VGEPPGDVVLHRRPRLPPIWIGFSLLIVLILAVALITTAGPPTPNPNAWWQSVLLALLLIAIPGIGIIPRTWAEVVVTERGLRVRDREVIGAGQIGTVAVLGRFDSIDAGYSNRWRDQRIPKRQNLYAGGYLNRGVLVEHLRPGGASSLWLLPGPDAGELAAALRAVRTTPPSQLRLSSMAQQERA
jgi:hypothetical protein